MKTVVDPSGNTWRVGRLWFTRKARWRSPLRPRQAWDVTEGFDLADLLSDVPGIGAAIALLVGALVLVALSVLFVFPAVILLVEVCVVVLIGVAALAARILLRRPWIVIARQKKTEQVMVRRVVGFRASGRAARELAEDVARGRAPRV